MSPRFTQGVAFAIVALFAVTLVDYLILAQLGVRLLPLDYEVLEILFFVLLALTVLVGFLVYRRPRAKPDGMFRVEVAGYRLVFAFCVIPMAATAVGFLGAFSWFVDILSNFRLQYAGSLLTGAVVLGLFRHVRLAALVLAFGLVNLAASAPQLVAWQTAEAGAGTKLRFVLANVNVMNQNHQAMLSFIEEAEPDVFVLQEVNQRWADSVVASLGDEYPYSIVEPQEGFFGIGLWSRVPIVSGETRYFLEERIPAIVATVDASGREVLLISTHAMPPRSAFHVGIRERQLEAMSELARTARSELVVLAASR